MLPITPAGLLIDRQALTVLRGVLAAALPDEGCALLLGRGAPGGRLWWLQRVWPALNTWEPAGERSHRFQLDPREQLLAQRWARSRGLAVLGAAHSHPAGRPVPSATDLALTAGPTLMLILAPPALGGPPCAGAGPREEPLAEGMAEGMEGGLGCWWLSEGAELGVPAAPPSPLMWRMVD